MTDNQSRKLRPKYLVTKVGEEDTMKSTDPNDIDSPFVLMPRKDPAAFSALIYYAQCCEPKLGAEIAQWLSDIAKAPPAFGTQGFRNFMNMRIAAIEQI